MASMRAVTIDPGALTLGQVPYAAPASAPPFTLLAGNTTTTRKFLRQTGTGAASAAPAWDTLQAGDLPAGAGADVSYPRQAGTSPLEIWYVNAITQYADSEQLTLGLSADVFYAVPIMSGRGGTLDRMRFWVTTAAAAGKNARVGIYTATSMSNIYPDALVLDCGAVAVDSNGAKTLTIAQALSANILYWLAILSNGAPTITALGDDGALLLLGVDGSSGGATPYNYLSVARAYGALPATFPAGGALTSGDFNPLFSWRYSA